MDAVAVWSRRLAEQLAPAEAASAERVGAAYVSGGRRRRDLMRSTAAEPGGFGGAGAAELPIILDALRVVSGDLLGLLGNHPLAGVIALLAMRAAARGTPPDPVRWVDQGPAPAYGQGGPAPGAGPQAHPGSEPAHGPDPASAQASGHGFEQAQAPAPASDPAASAPALDQAIAGLRERLRAHGVAPERAEALTYDTLKLVFRQDRDPAEIDAFLRALAGSPPSAPPAAQAATATASPAAALPATRGEGSGWMLPPWLWLYFLGVLAPNAPQAIASIAEDVEGMATLFGYLGTGVERAGVAVLTASGLLEFLPALLLLAGLAGVLLPGTRGRWVERRHRLLPPGDDPVLNQMEAFVRRHAPGAGIRLGERHDRLARVYPVGWREARVAVYPPLVRLWGTDREAAQAVLLHEVAHLRQGDHLIVGLASPFAWLVRIWAVALIVLAVIPVTFYVLLGGPAASAAVLPALLAAFEIPISLILPVAGLWVAELSADRYAVNVVGPSALARALGPTRPHVGVLHRIFGLLSHPPSRLRLWSARSWPGGTAALAALWPLAYVLWLAGVSLFEVLAHMLLDSSFGDALATAIDGLPRKLAAARTELAEMAVLLVNWPLIAPLWLRVWTPLRATRHRLAPYLAPTLVPCLLLAGGLTAGTPSELTSGTQANLAIDRSPVATPTQPPPPAVTVPASLTPGPGSAATPERTGVIDDRPWAGQPLPVSLRLQPPYQKLNQLLGDPAWRNIAAGWLGAGVWRAEKDGRLTFTDLMKRPDLHPTGGYWFRQADTVTFWLPIEQGTAGQTTTFEINGTIDLGQTPAVIDAHWFRKFDGTTNDTNPWPMIDFAAALDITSSP
ncbi:M48 family metalloprotease [Thermopolyspora sp. NPDC052614]|uniref:M48 family metalloprotease n=1 Tax=Thermopolyspora sp. NPDC052614 TaxID=3155682 RepID=UPI003449A1F4